MGNCIPFFRVRKNILHYFIELFEKRSLEHFLASSPNRADSSTITSEALKECKRGTMIVMHHQTQKCRYRCFN